MCHKVNRAWKKIIKQGEDAGSLSSWAAHAVLFRVGQESLIDKVLIQWRPKEGQ